ncbi:TPA: glycosyltransferase [Enterococcus faecium]|nr:glycosyltransferase [Enterococcus faecium]
MKILVISQRKLLPMTDGALVGSMGLLTYLKDLGHCVQIVHFIENDKYTSSELDQLQKIVERVHTVPLKWRSTALNLSFKYPNSIRKYTRRCFKTKVLKVKKSFDPDIVIIDHLQMFEYSKLFPGMKCILHTHNIETSIWREFSKGKKGLVKLLLDRNVRLLSQYEANALNSANFVTACSDGDLIGFKKMSPSVNGAVFHSYIKFPVLKSDEDIEKCKNRLVFVGSYGWFPNQLAAKFLAEELMPRLRKKIKGITLVLVGKDPTDEIKSYAQNNSDIIVTGTVPSIDPYLKEADIFINAVNDGSGINIKIIEALGKGVPVVTSFFGTRGLTIRHEVEALVYETLDSCEEQIIRLLKDRELAKELSKNGRKCYEFFIKPDSIVENEFSTKN